MNFYECPVSRATSSAKTFHIILDDGQGQLVRQKSDLRMRRRQATSLFPVFRSPRRLGNIRRDMYVRKVVHISVGIATGGLFALKAAPHLFPQELCQRPMQLKLNSEPFPVPERCKHQFQQVAAEMGITNAEENVSLFVCAGFSPLSAGATWLPNGAVIGLPRSLLFEREVDVINSGAVFKNRSINWNTKLGHSLRESLVNTDNDIAFILGHELGHLKSVDFKHEAVLAPTWLYATYKLADSTKSLLPRTPKLLDVILKGGICLLGYTSYWKLSRLLHCQQEFKADKVAAECSLRIANGGVSSMLKRLKLNSVLRVLHGTKGKRLYSKDGELTRNSSHPRLHERMRRLEQIVDKKMAG